MNYLCREYFKHKEIFKIYIPRCLCLKAFCLFLGRRKGFSSLPVIVNVT